MRPLSPRREQARHDRSGDTLFCPGSAWLVPAETRRSQHRLQAGGLRHASANPLAGIEMAAEWKTFDRQSLYDLVWSEPATKLALRFGYSDVGFAKICRKLGVPLPERGYWAQVAAGHTSRKVPLPRPRPEQDRLVKLRILPQETQSRLKERKDNLRTARVTAALVAAEGSAERHPAIEAAMEWLKAHPDKAKEGRQWSRLMYQCTPGSEDRGVRLLRLAVHFVESNGGRVSSAEGELHAAIEGTTLFMRVSEKVSRQPHVKTAAEAISEAQYWKLPAHLRSGGYPYTPQYDYVPTGILTFSCDRRNWSDTRTKTLEERFESVMSGLIVHAKEKKVEEDERAERERQHQRKVDAYNEAIRKRTKERSDFLRLRNGTRRWELAARMRAYIDAIESSASDRGGPTAEEREWIAWARHKADWVDPLVKMSDIIVDSPSPKPPGYSWRPDDG
jgi:hypothetical protein